MMKRIGDLIGSNSSTADQKGPAEGTPLLQVRTNPINVLQLPQQDQHQLIILKIKEQFNILWQLQTFSFKLRNQYEKMQKRLDLNYPELSHYGLQIISPQYRSRYTDIRLKFSQQIEAQKKACQNLLHQCHAILKQLQRNIILLASENYTEAKLLSNLRPANSNEVITANPAPEAAIVDKIPLNETFMKLLIKITSIMAEYHDFYEAYLICSKKLQMAAQNNILSFPLSENKRLLQKHLDQLLIQNNQISNDIKVTIQKIISQGEHFHGSLDTLTQNTQRYFYQRITDLESQYKTIPVEKLTLNVGQQSELPELDRSALDALGETPEISHYEALSTEHFTQRPEQSFMPADDHWARKKEASLNDVQLDVFSLEILAQNVEYYQIKLADFEQHLIDSYPNSTAPKHLIAERKKLAFQYISLDREKNRLIKIIHEKMKQVASWDLSAILKMNAFKTVTLTSNILVEGDQLGEQPHLKFRGHTLPDRDLDYYYIFYFESYIICKLSIVSTPQDSQEHQDFFRNCQDLLDYFSALTLHSKNVLSIQSDLTENSQTLSVSQNAQRKEYLESQYNGLKNKYLQKAPSRLFTIWSNEIGYFPIEPDKDPTLSTEKLMPNF